MQLTESPCANSDSTRKEKESGLFYAVPRAPEWAKSWDSWESSVIISVSNCSRFTPRTSESTWSISPQGQASIVSKLLRTNSPANKSCGNLPVARLPRCWEWYTCQRVRQSRAPKEQTQITLPGIKSNVEIGRVKSGAACEHKHSQLAFVFSFWLSHSLSLSPSLPPFLSPSLPLSLPPSLPPSPYTHAKVRPHPWQVRACTLALSGTTDSCHKAWKPRPMLLLCIFGRMHTPVWSRVLHAIRTFF